MHFTRKKRIVCDKTFFSLFYTYVRRFYRLLETVIGIFLWEENGGRLKTFFSVIIVRFSWVMSVPFTKILFSVLCMCSCCSSSPNLVFQANFTFVHFLQQNGNTGNFFFDPYMCEKVKVYLKLSEPFGKKMVATKNRL